MPHSCNFQRQIRCRHCRRGQPSNTGSPRLMCGWSGILSGVKTMRVFVSALIIVALVIGAAVVMMVHPASSQSVPQYRVMQIVEGRAEPILNQQAQDGWQLVTLFTNPSGGWVTLVLRRP